MALAWWIVLTIIAMVVSHRVKTKQYGDAAFAFCLFLMGLFTVLFR